MAEKRMFTKKVIESDAFLDMPLATQALYIHLNMRADDDGFINNSHRIIRTIGASDDDLRLLSEKRFIIVFENGVIVIKHWFMHNTLRKDRHKWTQYQEEFETLIIKPNKSYTEKQSGNCLATRWQPDGNRLATTWQPDDNCLEPQERVGKRSIVEGRGVEEGPPTPPVDEEAYLFLVRKYGKSFVDERVGRSRKYSGTNMETVKKWCEEDYGNTSKATSRFNNFDGRQYDMDELEKKLMVSKKTVDDP